MITRPGLASKSLTLTFMAIRRSRMTTRTFPMRTTVTATEPQPERVTVYIRSTAR